jgi:cytosine/adenosine deaminase-related metal-dependent hydrolase/ubiquinone/menaquinone biosynthesis C-methylase UbiE
MSSSLVKTSLSPHEPDSQIFDLWAQVYDSQSNPLLTLEERHVLPLLPPLAGRDVLDVGCGSGRWLHRLEEFGPASLSGTDYSAVMLQQAREKVHNTTVLYQGDCSLLPGEDAIKDLLLASFLLSYLPNLQQFAQECARIITPGGCLLISDMHPVTEAKRKWKRSFSLDEATFNIASYVRPLEEIIAVFQKNLFDVQVLIEPSFDTPELTLFESTGRLKDYTDLTGVAAIYILKLQKKQQAITVSTPIESALRLDGSNYASGPDRWIDGAIKIEGDRISEMGRNISATSPGLDLTGYCILPGLINAHDHLEFGLFPNLGRRTGDDAYKNSAQWAQDIHHTYADVIAQHLCVPKGTRLWWGAIRNLICGVTTVCHHNPTHPDFDLPEFPVRVMKQFGWSHSLAFDSQLAEKFFDTPSKMPFIFHAGEGIDQESRNELFILDQMHLLDKRTVIVHGLAINAEAASLINKRDTSLITCPSSNCFLFSQTISHSLLTSLHRVALGSDSPISATGDLLDEIRFAHREIAIDVNTIYNMVTSNSANILHLRQGEGHLEKLGVADMIAIRSQGITPALALSELTWDKVELVILSGKVHMASQSIFARLPQYIRAGMDLLDIADQQRWIRAPLRHLFSTAESILGSGRLQIGGRQVRYLGAL